MLGTKHIDFSGTHNDNTLVICMFSHVWGLLPDFKVNQTKVGDFQDPSAIHHAITGLEVAMGTDLCAM